MIRTIYDDYNTKDYEEWAKEEILENGYAESEEDINEEELYDRVWEMIIQDWDEMVLELDNIFTGNVLVFGTVGRWDGTSYGFEVCEDIEEAVSFMLTDHYNVKVYDDDGHLHFVNMHHDGRNEYEVIMLTDEGWEHFEKWNYGEINRSVGEILTELVNEYSILPNYCKKVWGVEEVI